MARGLMAPATFWYVSGHRWSVDVPGAIYWLTATVAE